MILAATALLTLHSSQRPRTHGPRPRRSAGLDSPVLPRVAQPAFLPPGTTVLPRVPGLAAPWESLCSLWQRCHLTFGPHGCASVLPGGCCACQSVHGSQISDLLFGLLGARLCLCLPPSLVVQPHSLSCFCPSHSSSPSEPPHQLMGYHFSIDRVGLTFQGPFCPRNLVLCFPSEEG